MTADRLTACQTVYGLVHHSLKNRSGQVFLGSTFVDQGLDIGLGKYTAQASGIFMMMVVGGGIFPLLQQVISDAVGYMASYWLIIFMLAYLLFYGLVGCKNVNKDIPVE